MSKYVLIEADNVDVSPNVNNVQILRLIDIKTKFEGVAPETSLCALLNPSEFGGVFFRPERGKRSFDILVTPDISEYLIAALLRGVDGEEEEL